MFIIKAILFIVVLIVAIYGTGALLGYVCYLLGDSERA